MNNCYFCKVGKNFSVAKTKLGEQWPFENDVVYYDEAVFAVVGSAPQVIPYILILPYRHIFSLSQMNEYEWYHFIKCLHYLQDNGGFGHELCFFEHGGRATGGASSIDHCHIHVIDEKIKFYDNYIFDDYTFYEKISSVSMLNNMEHYLLIGKFQSKNNINIKISNNQNATESQFFRKKLAEHIGSKDWDWHIDNKINKMITIMEGFQ